MKAKIWTYILALSVLAVSCKDKVGDPAELTIGFGVEQTKTFIGSAAALCYDGSSFEMNAAYSSGSSFNAGSATTLMDRRTVSYDADRSDWFYRPAEFWLQGECYHFRAIYPAETVENLTETLVGNGLSFDYTVPSDPAVQSDILVSQLAEVVTPAPMESPIPPVGLSFSHILSNVRILTKKADAVEDEVEIEITRLELSGMKDSGSYTHGAPGSWDTSAGNILTCSAPAGAVLAKGTWTSLFGDGLLLIPQALADEALMLTMDYTITRGGDVNDIHCKLGLPAPPGGEWLPGNTYNYKLDMKEDNETIIIIFEEVIVSDWADDDEEGTYEFQP